MNQASSADCSTLKNAVLEMWVPAVGAETFADVWAKNWNKFVTQQLCEIFNIPRNLTCVIQDRIDKSSKQIWKSIFQTNFESYFDTQPPFQFGEAILTGSLREGLFLYTLDPPDMDFLCVLKNISFSKEDQEDCCLALREDTPFVHAFITNKETQNLWSEFFDEVDKKAGKPRLSSRKLKEKLKENYQNTGGMFRDFGKQFEEEQLKPVAEGAAVTICKPKPSVSIFQCATDLVKEMLRQPVNEGLNVNEVSLTQMMNAFFYKLVPSSDIVLSIFCEGWPYCAREWTTRQRIWPDMHSVEKIAQSGFHIVPKSSADGDFRLSFSCAEAILVETLSPIQHKVMRAFKAVVKYHENTLSPHLKDIISSYHLKTIAFWHFEKTSQEPWSEETLVHHLVTLLEELAEALRMQDLQMYFMPKVNLLKDVDDPEVMLELMEEISQLSHNFVSMSEAVSDYRTLKESAIVFDCNHGTDLNIFDTLHEEKNKKAEEGGESLFTFYDLIVAMQNIVK